MQIEAPKKIVKVEKLHCQQCGNTWEPRKKGNVPARCPKCLRGDWWKKKI